MSNQTDTPFIPCVSPTPGRVTTLPDGTRLTSWDARGRMRTAIAVALLGMSSSTASLAQARQVMLPEGTAVFAATVGRISSATAVVGDQMRLRVEQHVVVDSAIVVARGAIIRGVVSEVGRRGALGRAGRLNIRLESTTAVDGQRIALRASEGTAGDGRVGTTVALVVLLGPLGLLKGGKDAVIDEGTAVMAFTDEPATISVLLTPLDTALHPPAVPLAGLWMATVDGTIFTLSIVVENGGSISGSGDIDRPKGSLRPVTITGISTETDVGLTLAHGATRYHLALRRVSATELQGVVVTAGAPNMAITLLRQ